MKPLFSEAIKLNDGKLYNLEYHQARIHATLEHFYGTNIDLSQLISNIPDNCNKGLFKCRIVYGAKIESIEFQPYQFRKINKVGIVKADDINYRYKSIDRTRLNQLLHASKCDDIIIVKNGFITDSFAGNLVFESSSGLSTPHTYLLPGTKRASLIHQGLIKETEIRLSDLHDYTRLYFINALIDLADNISIPINTLNSSNIISF